jgi:pimeloyl-ACP methyl ester carboxylesterase
MATTSARVTRGIAAVCLGFAVACVLAPASARAPEVGRSHARTVADRASESGAREEPLAVAPGAFAYAPRDASEPRPAVVYLHGRCGVTTNGCPYFRAGAQPFGWLVCPQANAKCPGAGASWGGSIDERRAIVDGAIAGVDEAFPGKLDTSTPGVLVGFSQGAWLAIDLARKEPGRWSGLLLIGADVDPRPADLRAAGVRRVVLAAGRYDGAYGAMVEETKRLIAAGIDARFVGLGLVGHTYAAEDPDAMTSSLAWLTQG